MADFSREKCCVKYLNYVGLEVGDEEAKSITYAFAAGWEAAKNQSAPQSDGWVRLPSIPEAKRKAKEHPFGSTWKDGYVAGFVECVKWLRSAPKGGEG